MTNQELRAQAEAMLKDQNFSDFRDLIAASEGGTYNRLFGFDNQGRPRYFSDFSKFPDSPAKYQKADGTIGESNDAGRYQININTYNRLAKNLGITDFSPRSQDIIANALILENSKASKALQAGDIGAAVSALNKVWVSLPGGPNGVGHRSMQFIQDAYNNIRARRGAAPVQLASNLPIQASTTVGNFFSSRAPQGSFFNRAMSTIINKSYANAVADGIYPFANVNTSNLAISGNPDATATDSNGNNILLSRLFNNDPNTTYGAAFADNGIRPIVTDKQGTQLIEDNNKLAPVEIPTPVYDATLSNSFKGSPEELLAPSAPAEPIEVTDTPTPVNGVIQEPLLSSTSEAVLPDNTPLIDPTGNAASNIGGIQNMVSPADMLANIQATNLETLRRSAGLRPDDAIDQLIPDRDAARKLFNESDTTRKIIT